MIKNPSLFRLFSGTLLAGALSMTALAGCKSTDTAGGGALNAAAETEPAREYEGENLVIGHFGSLTGSTATFGKSTDNGIRLAFKEINAAGGVLGKQLVLETADDSSKTEQVVPVVQKLINQNNVLALLGEVASSRSLAAAPAAQAAGVPMISPASTNPDVTKAGNYIFRTCFIDSFQGSVMARFAAQHVKAKKVAILTDVANDYSKGLTEVFRSEWTKSGGQIVAEESYAQDDSDFQAQLTKIKAANPDAIFIPGYYTEVANIAVQARRMDIKQPMMGCDGWDSPDLFKIARGALQGCYFSNHYSAEDKAPVVANFVAAYKKEYQAVPDAMAALGYDAARILADAIKRAGGTDRAKIRDAIAATKNFKGVTGTISIDKDRNAVKPAVVLRIDGNVGKYVTTINP